MQLRTRSGKALVLILGISAALALAAGLGVGLFMARRAQASSDKGGQAHARKQEEVKTIHSLDEMVVNLADLNSMRYAKVSVALGITEKVEDEKMKEYDPRLKDAIINVLTSKRFAELRRPGALPKLKEEIRAELAQNVPDLKVVQVYFEGFAMQ